MSGRRSMRVSFEPPAGTEPRSTFQPYEETTGLAYLHFMSQFDHEDVCLTFDPRTPAEAIRYLRQLAATATDLADEVERAATTDAALKS